jgi:DNA polymerase III alpha subunit (gram-positive type)
LTSDTQNPIESAAAAASEGLPFGGDSFERLLDAGADRVDAFRIKEAVRKGKALELSEADAIGCFCLLLRFN